MKVYRIRIKNECGILHVVAATMKGAVSSVEQFARYKESQIESCEALYDVIVGSEIVDDDDIYVYLNSEIDKVKKMIKEGY